VYIYKNGSIEESPVEIVARTGDFIAMVPAFKTTQNNMQLPDCLPGGSDLLKKMSIVDDGHIQ
jgi:hypothetical protein